MPQGERAQQLTAVNKSSTCLSTCPLPLPLQAVQLPAMPASPLHTPEGLYSTAGASTTGCTASSIWLSSCTFWMLPSTCVQRGGKGRGVCAQAGQRGMQG